MIETVEKVFSGITDWAANSKRRVQEHGWFGTKSSAYSLYLNAAKASGVIYNYGTPIYEKEWDVLIVLDALRADIMQEVDSDYNFLNHPGTINSVGGTSWEWQTKTFSSNYADEVSKTIYVTANPHTSDFVDPDAFRVLDEVWQYAWDDEAETVPPRPVTDRAIHHRRRNPDTRMVVHYMQPHRPFLDSDIEPGVDYDEKTVETTPGAHWGRVRNGEVGLDTIRAAFRRNTEIVLKDVSLLLQNMDADKVAITADHGECLGECGIYGHHSRIPISALKRVPWYTTQAVDQHTHEPDQWGGDEKKDVEERLQALGYT